MRDNAITFISGRIITLFILLSVQILIVRLLPTAEYGYFALIFAFATLMQTTVSFGIPRIISKYVTRAGGSLSFSVVRGLASWLLIIRIGASFTLILTTLAVTNIFGWMQTVPTNLLLSSIAYILIQLAQIDGDAMAQALGLQGPSRMFSVGEAGLRLPLIALAGMTGYAHTAVGIIAISAFTSALAATGVLISVFRALSKTDDADAPGAIDWPELRRTALGGYASSMAWFASSPAVVRLIGGSALAIREFSGFAFAQTLVLSFQRYTPGFMVFPFVEPTAMKHFDRTGDRHRLECALSLVTKIDILLIGATVIGTAIAGDAIVGLLADGKYTAQAYALPWLLIYIMTSSAYRSFEVVAIALNAMTALVRTLSLSLIWLVAAIFLARYYGLIALLICPVGDALSRLVLMSHALRKVGIRHVIDMKVIATAFPIIAGFSMVGRAISNSAGLTTFPSICLGSGLAGLYLVIIMLARPLRAGERDIVFGASPRSGKLAWAIDRLVRN